MTYDDEFRQDLITIAANLRDAITAIDRVRDGLRTGEPSIAVVPMTFVRGDFECPVRVSLDDATIRHDSGGSIAGLSGYMEIAPELLSFPSSLRRFRLESPSLAFNAATTRVRSGRVDFQSSGIVDIRLPWKVVDGRGRLVDDGHRSVPPTLLDAIAALTASQHGP